jgi:hypothetical protein
MASVSRQPGQSLARPTQKARSRDEEPWPGLLPDQDRELLAQGEVLKNQVGVGAEQGADGGREDAQQGEHTNLVAKRTDSSKSAPTGDEIVRRCAGAPYAKCGGLDFSVGTGVDRAEARRRAEDAVVRIEGSLIVAAGTGDPQVFRRAIEGIRATLLSPLRESR